MTGIEDIHTRKASLRDAMKRALASLSPQTRDSASRRIARNLMASQIWEPARSVMGFLADDREPNLDPLLESAMGAGVRVFAPRMDWETGTMAPRELDAIDLIETRKHGIREPLGGAESREGDPMSLDVVLVPGLAFDAAGNRLGRGAGFYDRFLATLPQTAHIVGVCFEVQRIAQVPAAPHDAPVRMLVTETGVHPVRSTQTHQ